MDSHVHDTNNSNTYELIAYSSINLKHKLLNFNTHE